MAKQKRSPKTSGGTEKREQRISDLLVKSYNAELETVANYLANSVNLDGIRASHIKESLAADVTAELGHAQRLAARIRIIGGTVPGSRALRFSQDMLQPPKKTTDVLAVIKGVIDAEEDAIRGYRAIVEACEGKDYVTQDLAIEIMSDEEEHRREFIGFLREYEEQK